MRLKVESLVNTTIKAKTTAKGRANTSRPPGNFFQEVESEGSRSPGWRPQARNCLERRVIARRYARDKAWSEPVNPHKRRVPGSLTLLNSSAFLSCLLGIKVLAVMCAAVLTLGRVDTALALAPQLVESFKDQLANQICSADRKWLACYRLDPSKCHEVSSRLAAECVKSVLLPRADSLRDENGAGLIAQDIYNCLKSNFKRDHGANRIDSQGCAGLD